MQITGSGLVEARVIPSSNGVLRGMDTVASDEGAYGLGTDQTNVAAQYSMVQLFNPAASGIVALVDAIIANVQGAADYSTRHYDTQLATDVGAGDNKTQGGAAAACHVRRATGVALLGTDVLVYNLYQQALLPTNEHVPYYLQAGEGLLVVCRSVNNGLGVAFSWREV